MITKTLIKQLTKLLCFLLLLTVSGCQKDSLNNPLQEQTFENRIKKISLEEFENREGISKDFVKLSKTFDVNREISSQYNRLEQDDDPWLMTDEIAMIEKENTTSYTFRIGKQAESIEFYNFVVVFDDMGNILSARILEYIPNEIWLQDTSQPFVGEVSLQENTFFSTGDITSLFSARIEEKCVVGATGTSYCNLGGEGHYDGHPLCTQGTSWNYVVNLEYGPCPEEDNDDSNSNSYPVGSDTGSGASGGTANNNDENCIPSIDNPCDEDETTILTSKDDNEEDEDESSPCDNINKLKNDDVFKQKMVTLKNAAQQWSFEKLFTVSTDLTPNTSLAQTDNYDYGEFQGTISNPRVKWGGVSPSKFQGIIHSHFSDLLSVHSVDDLVDLYNIMKNSSVTDNFFYGMVNDTGTAYILQINDRSAFLSFGDEWLSSKNRIYRFTKYKINEKYNINKSNSNNLNEMGFVKMLQEMSSGLSVFKSTDGTFSDYKKLNLLNNQVVPSDCN